MSDLISHTARLVPYTKRPKHSASFVTAYYYEPGVSDVGAWLGNLYVVVEVLVSGRASEEVVDLIIQTAGDKYYNEARGETEALARFEATVKHVNQALSEYVGRGNAAWIGKLSAVIAIQTDSELHLTQTGSGEAFLYRGKATSRISLSETSRPTTPSKTFGSIATGELEAGDKLLIATPALIHQIPLAKLQSVISNESPNSAIAEISQLLQGAITNRIAALVVEITTPELAALRVRSEAPEEIQLATRENLAETAIRATIPIAQTTAVTSKKVAGAAHASWRQLKPKLRAASLWFIDQIRLTLSRPKGRRIAAVTGIVVLIIIGAVTWINHKNAASLKQFSSYQTLFQRYLQTQPGGASGNKTATRAALADIMSKLNNLSPNEATINTELKNNALLQGEPLSMSAFKTLVADQIDQLDGLIKATPVTVASLSGKNAKPSHFESDGSNAYVIDSANHNQISIINLQTGSQQQSKADASQLTNVVSTTLSAANDGMFILTGQPSVWFYRFATDTLTQQTIAYDQWPKAFSVGSYGPNLYLLDNSTIYKHVRNATGYSPKSNYIPTAQLSGKPTSMAIDGWIYIATDQSLNRFLGSALKQSITNPTSLKHITTLRSTNGGSLIIGVDQTSNRIATWTATGSQINFDKQISLNGAANLYDATYDARLGEIFATIDHRLISLPFKPEL